MALAESPNQREVQPSGCMAQARACTLQLQVAMQHCRPFDTVNYLAL